MIKTLSPADSIFFFTESDTQHQHVMGIMLLDPSTAAEDFSVETLIEQSEDLVDDAPGYLLKFVDSPAALGVPMLAEDPDFNFRNHIHHIALPAPGSRGQLSELVADIASRPLNRHIPLWENWYVSGLEGGLIAIVSKSHHSMSDGVSGAETMARMFDLEPNPPKREKAPKPPRARVKAPTTVEIMQAALKTRRNAPSTISTMSKLVKGTMKRREVSANCENPELLPGNSMKAPKLFFNGEISSLRSVAMGTLSLTDVKSVKNAFRVTLNDTILTVVAIAVRRYLELHDDMPEEALGCMVPISLSLNKEAGEARGDDNSANQVDTMNVRFPVQITDPVELIQTIARYSNASKQRFNDTYDNLVLTVVDTLPPQMAAPAMAYMTGDFSSRFPISNLGVSNIPGPNFPLYMRGAKVVGNYPMGPIPNGIGLGITLMSYMDEIHFTVQGCREKTPDIKVMLEYMSEAMEDLLKAAEKVGGKAKTTPKPGAAKKADSGKRKPAVKKKAAAKKPAAKKAKARPKTAIRKKAPARKKAAASKAR